MRKINNEKLDRGVKKVKIVYYLIAAITTVVSLVIFAATFMPRRSKKIESVADCPEELIPGQDDDDDEVEEL